ncbi:MAG: hypothetical protein IKD89_08055, partial [Clostridia bacterium]|nr:hypothetical protein [Clostridia bacterium]
GGGGGGGGGNSGGHSIDEEAEEDAVVAVLAKIVNQYGKLGYSDAQAPAYECLGKLIATVDKAVQADKNGAFIDRAYVKSHYSSEIEDFKAAYNALDKTQQDNLKTLGARLGTTEELDTVFGFFGVDSSSLD